MKKAVSIILALLLLVTCVAGCAKDSNGAADANMAQSGTKEEPYEVRMVIALPATAPADNELKRVISKVNEITLEKLNMTLKLEILPFSMYLEQVQMELSSGGDIDLFTSIASYGPSWVNSGYLVDMGPLLEEYAPDLLSTYSSEELAKVMSLNGFLYGVPVHKEVAMQPTVFFRTDILEKHGIDVSGVKSLADLDAVYEQVAALEPGMWMLAADNTGYDKSVEKDTLGGSSTTVGLVEPETNTQVVELVATEQFKEWCQYNHKWFEKGWINSGAASDTESYYSYIASGQAFSFFSDYGHPLSKSDQQANCSGTELTMITLDVPYSTTTSSAVFGYSISSGSKNPQKAMQMLNFIMTSPEVMNLLNWGVEGEDYVVNSDGLLEFPEGKDLSSVGYHLDAGWILPNQFLCTPWHTQQADIYDQVKAYNDSAVCSKALGFTFDPEPVADIVSAISNVRAKYYKALIVGAVDPDEYIPIYLEELKNAGDEELIAEVQRQLDAYLAAQNG